LPAGASGSFNPATITGSGTSTWTVTTTTNNASGTYSLTILAISGNLTNKTTVALILQNSSAASGAVNVTQHHNNLSRSGLYIDPAFTTANVAGLARDLAFNGSITGEVYAQPLYIEGGPGGLAVVVVVTESNSVYALNATNGTIVWQTQVAPPVQSGVLPCGNITPTGITGTPVVDLPSRALFFDALTEQPGTTNVEHLVFSLNVDTGSVNPGWPLNVNNNAFYGSMQFVSLAQGERGALTIIGANLYVPYGGLNGDCGSYHGWVVGMPLINPSNNVMAWATTANGGGAWSVGGLASDGVNVFVATGNTFNVTTWSGGEAILNLTPSLALNGTTDYWAPTNWTNLDAKDLDIGGSGPLLVNVPGATPSNLVVALGKDGNAYLLTRTNLGGVSAPVAQLAVGSGKPIVQAAATYQTTNGTYVVFANSNNLYALLISASSPPTITSEWTAVENGKGSPFVTTTDGTNNVVVWGIGTQGSQRLYGFDGDTGATVFAGGGTNELMANTRNYNTGLVARGRIYVAGDNQVYAFSLPGTGQNTILGAGFTNGTFQISFAGPVGPNYVLQVSRNLMVWTSIITNTPVTSPFVLVAPSAPGTARFYRVVQEP
jgi:outer membrane protein assembly factor BamB